MDTIDNATARRLVIERTGLAEPPGRALDDAALLERIERLGFVQIDSINVVERAHHQILFSRTQAYRPRQLTRLVEKHALLFENWTHDASIIPASFFRYWRHRFARQKVQLRQRWKGHFGTGGFDEDIARVLTHVRDNGPVMTRDFQGDKPSTGWWDWHPSKAALEYLWRIGELAIARRDGFQKVYDLCERVVPQAHFAAEVSEAEFVGWACRSALHRLGFATRGEIAAFWHLLSPDEVETWLAANSGELERARLRRVDGSDGPLTYALPGTLETLDDLPEPPARLRILSPFDPLMRDRARMERLFGFFYRIEIFVPEAKRQYGYYVFPVLRGDRVVGRIDMKADRASDRLAVKAFWPERGVRVSQALIEALDGELDRIRRFAGVSSVTHEEGWLRTSL